MGVDLSRKVGPLPVWGWVLVSGGTIGAIILVKKAKAAGAGEPTEPAQVVSGTSSGESGAGSGGGVSSFPDLEAKTPAPELGSVPQPVTSGTYELGGFAGEVNDVAEGKSALERLGLVVPRPAATTSTAGAAAQARHKATGGNPRKGLKFKPTTFHGQAAHEYPHAVPGGVGKGHNIIVLPVGKKNHAAKGDHAPAHAKRGAKAHHKPAPRKAPTRKAPHRRGHGF